MAYQSITVLHLIGQNISMYLNKHSCLYFYTNKKFTPSGVIDNLITSQQYIIFTSFMLRSINQTVSG